MTDEPSTMETYKLEDEWIRSFVSRPDAVIQRFDNQDERITTIIIGITRAIPKGAIEDLEDELSRAVGVGWRVQVKQTKVIGTDLENSSGGTIEVAMDSGDVDLEDEDQYQIDPEKYNVDVDTSMDMEKFHEAMSDFMDGLSDIAEDTAKGVSQFAQGLGSAVSFEEARMLSEYELQAGDPVRAANRDGGHIEGTLIDRTDVSCGSYQIRWSEHTYLYGYWENNPDVSKSDEVFVVDNGKKEYSYPESMVKLHPRELTDVSGIGDSKARVLYAAGWDTKRKLKLGTQQEISETTGVSNALAARIKADIGDINREYTDGHDLPVDDASGASDDPSGESLQCPYCDKEFQSGDAGAIEGDDGNMYCSISCLNEDIAYED